MVVVAYRLEIQQQRRMAEHPESGRAEERAFHAVRRAVAQHAARRTAGVAVRLLVVGQVEIEEVLDLLGRAETAKYGPFGSA